MTRDEREERFEALRRDWARTFGSLHFREELALDLVDDPAAWRDGRPRWLELAGPTLDEDLTHLGELDPPWLEELRIVGPLPPRPVNWPRALRTVAIDARDEDRARVTLDLAAIDLARTQVDALSLRARELRIDAGVRLPSVTRLLVDVHESSDVRSADFHRRLTCPHLRELDVSHFGTGWPLVELLDRHRNLEWLTLRFDWHDDLCRTLERLGERLVREWGCRTLALHVHSGDVQAVLDAIDARAELFAALESVRLEWDIHFDALPSNLRAPRLRNFALVGERAPPARWWL
jgi:hypothetical protein